MSILEDVGTALADPDLRRQVLALVTTNVGAGDESPDEDGPFSPTGQSLIIAAEITEEGPAVVIAALCALATMVTTAMGDDVDAWLAALGKIWNADRV